MGLRDRINHPDRRQDEQPIAEERRSGTDRREPFVAAWRRRSIEQAGGRFVAVAWREVPAA